MTKKTAFLKKNSLNLVIMWKKNRIFAVAIARIFLVAIA